MERMLKINQYVYIPLIILGCLQPFVTTEMMSLLGIAYFIYLLIHSKGKIKVGNSKLLVIIAIIFLIGVLMGIRNIGTRNYIRDIYYFANPVIFILIGLNLSNTKQDFNKLLKTIVYISLFLSLYGVFSVCISSIRGNFLFNFRTYFEYAIWGNVISIGILLAQDGVSNEGIYKKKNILLMFFIFTVILGMSRTVWIESVIVIVMLLFSDKQKFKVLLKTIFISIFVLFMLILIIRFIPQENVNKIKNKISNSFTEVSSKNTWDANEVQQNWRGYEIYNAKNQFGNYNVINQIFGSGFGTGIYVGNYTSLVHQSGEYIYVIHNGFYNILIKDGIVGVILYNLFFIELCIISCKIYKNTKSKEDLLIFSISICLYIYTYLVKGIFADFLQINALILIGGWMRYRRKDNYEINDKKY